MKTLLAPSKKIDSVSGTMREPTKILTDGDFVGIDWNDGHHSVHSKDNLRDACPCAFCLEERAASRDETRIPLISGRDTSIRSVTKVGLYGIRFTWGDGHKMGIYTYEYLRGLCECETCNNTT